MSVATILFVLAAALLAAEAVNADASGLALQGYDPVAYFTEGAPRTGDPSISAVHDGATYRFASTANREAFRADPEAYLPAYGGYCAWAVGQGYTAAVDPEAWTVHENRLYLNFSPGVRRRFDRSIDESIAAADANWPGLAAEL